MGDSNPSGLSSQELRLDAHTQELVVKFDKEPATSKQGQLLNALLRNSEFIQLKDGTVISVKDLTNRFEQAGGNVEDLEKALRISGGSGTGGGG